MQYSNLLAEEPEAYLDIADNHSVNYYKTMYIDFIKDEEHNDFDSWFNSMGYMYRFGFAKD